jgi:phosphoribosylaminoimidazole-succinocarboxamide synthase
VIFSFLEVKALELLRSGKVKSVYRQEDESVIIKFRDDITAGNGEKHDIMKGKGKLLNSINEIFFNLLSSSGIPTHYLRKVSDASFQAKKLEIIPLEVVVRNYAAGSFCKRYGIKKGKKVGKLVEFFLKDDDLSDPLICKDAVEILGIASEEELKEMKEMALKVNEVLSAFLKERSIILADFKVEFGKCDGMLMLGDEITPDTCRFWDEYTMNSLDKDVYRNSNDQDPLKGYEEVLRRIKK